MRKSFIDQGHPQLSLRRQATLLRVNRNRLVALDQNPTAEDLLLCREIDEVHMRLPFYGSRRMVRELRSRGFAAGRGRVRRLMRWMGLTATYPKPKTSKKAPGHKIYPYLLRDLTVDRHKMLTSAELNSMIIRCEFEIFFANYLELIDNI